MRKFSITIVGAKKWKADVLESELFKYKQNGSTDYNIKAKLHLTLNKFGIKVWHHLSKLRLLEGFLIVCFLFRWCIKSNQRFIARTNADLS